MSLTANPASVLPTPSRAEQRSVPRAAKDTAADDARLDAMPQDPFRRARQLRDEWRKRRYSRLKP